MNSFGRELKEALLDAAQEVVLHGPHIALGESATTSYAAHAWREEVDGTTARLGVQHLSLAPTCRKPRVISAVTIDDKE
jgi:hypothetical protein